MVLLWFLSGVLELSHTLASASKAAQHPLCPQPTLPSAPHWDVPPSLGQKNLLWVPSVNQTIEPTRLKITLVTLTPSLFYFGEIIFNRDQF